MERHISKWLAIGGLALVLWVARGILPPFVIAAILAYVLSPLVDELAARTRLPRRLAALAVFLTLLILFGVGSLLIGARLVAEARALTLEGPGLIQTIAERITGGQTFELLGQRVSSRELALRVNEFTVRELGNPAEALHAVRLAIEIGLNSLLCLLALAYLLLDGRLLGGFLLRFTPQEHRARAQYLTAEIHVVLGRYLRGQLFLIVIMSAVTFAVLEWIFHLPYALPIAIATGVLELIPLVGPVTAGAIACAVGFTQGGPGEAGALALTYFVLRQIEDQGLMPIIVGRAVHVHPLLTIFAVVTGERIAGILGMILAVPVVAAIKVILDYAYPAPGAQPGHPALAKIAPLAPIPATEPSAQPEQLAGND